MTAENIVYIPTLGRLGNLRKVVPTWLEQDIHVRLVVERYEYNDHAKLKREMRWGEEVVVLTQPLSGRGIGYVRNFCVQHADKTGNVSIIIAEDDTKPLPDSDMVALLDEADKPYVVGVGVVRAIYDLFTGGKISKMHGAILCPGGWGMQTFAVNVKTVLRLGNYDPRLHTMGDDPDMMMRGVEAGMPWRVHCDAKVAPIGNRYDPGGVSARFSSLEQRKAAEMECWAMLKKRWPDFINLSGKSPRFRWKKLYDKYIPEWHEYSALHGGDLAAYDNSPIEGENDLSCQSKLKLNTSATQSGMKANISRQTSSCRQY